MQYRNTLSLLACLLVASDAAVVKRTDCRAGQTTINGQLFTTQCDVDRAGNNLAAYVNGIQTSASGCQSLCASTSGCVSAEFHSSNGFCYPKGSQNQLSSEAGTYVYDNGDGCTSNISVAGCTVQCATDSPGNDIAASYAGSYLACAQTCAQNPNCVTAQYASFNGYCYQKSAINGDGFRTVQNVVSLVCAHN